jgi:hypothetical protein
MHEPLHPLVWMPALGAAVALLLSLGYGMKRKPTMAAIYVGVAVLLGLTSAVGAALVSGGYLTP